MGIHEARGYGRLFASIGLSDAVAFALGAKNYAGSEQGGLKWSDIDADTELRAQAYHSAGRGELSRVNHFYPKIWKAAGKLGKGESDWSEYEAHTQTPQNPIQSPSAIFLIFVIQKKLQMLNRAMSIWESHRTTSRS